MSKPKKEKTGRPPGSANIKNTSDAEPSRCPVCGSTNRGPYLGEKNVLEYAGEHNGKPYNRIVRRRCACADCGQTRIDCSHEFEPEAPDKKQKKK